MAGATSSDLVVVRREGLYCPAGDFYIDPWRRVERALITHAHADHARVGHAHYLAAERGRHVLHARLGAVNLQTLPWGESLEVQGVRVSFHPAGHVLGSSQVRLEHRGRVWVVSGDYFVSGAGDHNPTCDAFESVRCDTFITECTFGLPIYRWRAQAEIHADIHAWWHGVARTGGTCVVMAYSLGKAQRLLAGLDTSIGPIVVHDAVRRINEAYLASNVDLPSTRSLDKLGKDDLKGALVVTPPGSSQAAWRRGLEHASEAFASGWMQVRGQRRRQGVDRGFVLSDHADWPGLLQAIDATGASRVIVTHGQEEALVRTLRAKGLDAGVFRTAFGDDDDDGTPLDNVVVAKQDNTRE